MPPIVPQTGCFAQKSARNFGQKNFPRPPLGGTGGTVFGVLTAPRPSATFGTSPDRTAPAQRTAAGGQSLFSRSIRSRTACKIYPCKLCPAAAAAALISSASGRNGFMFICAHFALYLSFVIRFFGFIAILSPPCADYTIKRRNPLPCNFDKPTTVLLFKSTKCTVQGCCQPCTVLKCKHTKRHGTLKTEQGLHSLPNLL